MLGNVQAKVQSSCRWNGHNDMNDLAIMFVMSKNGLMAMIVLIIVMKHE